MLPATISMTQTVSLSTPSRWPLTGTYYVRNSVVHPATSPPPTGGAEVWGPISRGSRVVRDRMRCMHGRSQRNGGGGGRDGGMASREREKTKNLVDLGFDRLA
uniref:Uncharacterized protein n=1 Tax=Oryza sativa subsp. japonica TaxID=39947 RepID=Q5N705_ORYSJ|nr:hypothetical protein [Oryza sativa Japonica Group]BAD82751.1 hypothetical protein [Oryza sativa Japonica Group]